MPAQQREWDELEYAFRIPHDAPPRWLLVLTAYLDESGQDSADWVVVGGYLGNDEQWKALPGKWKIALGNRKSIHMKRLRWGSKPRRIAPLMQGLASAPEQCGLKRVIGGVKTSDYQDLIKRPMQAILEQGYLASLYPLILLILYSIPRDERLELVFEEQRTYRPIAERILSEMAASNNPVMRTSDGRPRLASWKFVPKWSTSLLEPSDVFVYSYLQSLRDPNSERTRICSPLLDESKSKIIGQVMFGERLRTPISGTNEAIALEECLSVNPKLKKYLHARENRELFRSILMRFMSLKRWAEN
jgi:hypothetical protein